MYTNAEKELARREYAKRDFLAYCHYVYPNFLEGTPQRTLADALHKVESGEISRLMVSMPPRHGKSVMVSQLFPCWLLGRDKYEIVQATYAHPLSVKHSRKARDIFTSQAHTNVFPDSMYTPERAAQAAIAIPRQAADEWGTAKGGTYYAVGIGGGLTGMGADIAIVDDPIKNRQEANSPTVRENAWDWYASTLYTRLSPTGAIVLVMTRWHPDDPAGRIEEQIRRGETEDNWHIINMPAWDESETNALWPERWPADKLQSIKSAIGNYEWSCLYMGQPTIRGGNLIKVDNIRWHNDAQDLVPTGYVRAWDLASTAKQRDGDDPDYTVGALLAITTGADGLDYCYLKDVVYGQWTASMRNQIILDTMRNDGEHVPVFMETVAGYKDTYDIIKELARGAGLNRIIQPVNGKLVKGDKVSKFNPVEAIIEGGRFHALNANWKQQTLLQLSEFPSGKHDDIPDAIGIAYMMAKTRHTGRNKVRISSYSGR